MTLSSVLILIVTALLCLCMHVSACVCVCMLALGSLLHVVHRLLFHIDRPYNCTYAWHYSSIPQHMYCVIFLTAPLKYQTALASVQDISSETEDDCLNKSSLSQSGMTLYLPTPDRMVRESVRLCAAIVPYKVCFMDLTRLDWFIKQFNHIRACATPGCKGELILVHVNSAGHGGAVTVCYTCSGCISKTAVIETSSRYELGNGSEVSIAMQVAIIIAGCMHLTYYKR